MPIPRLFRFALAGSLLIPLLAACTPVLMVEEPDDAANPDCATVMLRMPQELGGVADRRTSSQSTTAWGDPAEAIARCGVAPPAPTTDECVSVDGVDWVSIPGEEFWRFVTYGREPAVEVLVSRKRAAGQEVLSAISPSVSVIKQTRKCVGARDAEKVDAPVPANTAPASPGN